MEQEESQNKKRPKGLIIGGIIVVVVLLILGLFLPPISLGQRLGLTGEEPQAETAESRQEPLGSDVSAPDEATLPDGVTLALTGGAAAVQVVPQSEFFNNNANAATAVPENVTPVSDVYTISADGSVPTGQIALTIPANAGDNKTLDLYGWETDNWVFVPSQVDANSQQIVTAEGVLPAALVMMQIAPPAEVSVGAIVKSGVELPGEILANLTEVSVGPLMLDEQGTLNGAVVKLPDGPYSQWLHVTNVGPVVNQTALADMLAAAAFQEANINAIVEQAAADGFSGVNLDYQNVPAAQAAAFNSFANSLAEALHAQNMNLAVTLGAPLVAGSSWDTGGQDWTALGQLADAVYVKMPLDPSQYDSDDAASQLLNWAARQINRQKLSALHNGGAVDRIGETYTALSNENALANFGELQFVEGGEEVAPGETVTVALSGSASPLEWDGDSLTYKYSYEDEGQPHDVWLGSAAALSHRSQLENDYNIRGMAVKGLDDAGYAAALDSYKNKTEAPQPTGAAIVWTVRNASDSVLASESGNELTFSWDVGESEGDYIVNADFALGDNIANLDSLDVTVAAAALEEVVVETEETTEESETTEETEIAASTGAAKGVVNAGANVRTGPGLTYGTIAGGAEAGTEVDLIGRNSDISWLNVRLPAGEEGWIFATLITVDSGVELGNLEVVEVAPPAPAAANPGAGNDGGSDDGEDDQASAPAPPPPVAAAPVTNAGFELGGQSHSFGNPQLMSYAGMNWVKFQHKWGPGDDPNAVAGPINQAHGNGFKVLLSIPGTPYPSSIDFQEYVNFLGGVAALGPDAIEVWNEMNIDFEWPAGQINAQSYVNNMLAPAYNAIKGANPNVMVISGAPAPTGYFGGGCSTNGCDDSAYLAGMAAAGAANYMDCMGAHFNAGATSPGQSTGHPAGSDHYSWYFQPMLDLYYNTLGKPVCFTELGFLSGDDFGGVPSRFSWAGNTSVSEHAQWLAEAISLAANSGKARLAIIFNVDFTQWGDDPQAGYAMIRPDGSCPACETLRQVMGN